ncbi:MAG TPA: hypothetical protein VKB81_12480 [Nitrospira sp.]|jgi:hypothetical protein|nr:hypothetical protein [Nitrospira sp.]
MGNIDLASLIVGVVGGIAITQLVMWVLVMVRHPGFEWLRPDAPFSPTSLPPDSARKESRARQGSPL